MPEEQTQETSEQEPSSTEPEAPAPATEPEADWKSKARLWEQRAKENFAAKQELDQIRDAQKTETEKLNDKLSQAESRTSSAETDLARLRVAMRKGLTESQAKRLVGKTEEELEQDADEMLKDFQREEPEGKENLSRRPQERLRPGNTPSEDRTPQLAREDLKTMTPQQIEKARQEGRLDAVMGHI